MSSLNQSLSPSVIIKSVIVTQCHPVTVLVLKQAFCLHLTCQWGDDCVTHYSITQISVSGSHLLCIYMYNIKWYIFKPCLCHRGCVLTNCFFVQNERIASLVMACFLCSLINVCADLLVIFWQLWLWEVPTSAAWITHLSLVNSVSVNSVKCKCK